MALLFLSHPIDKQDVKRSLLFAISASRLSSAGSANGTSPQWNGGLISTLSMMYG